MTTAMAMTAMGTAVSSCKIRASSCRPFIRAPLHRAHLPVEREASSHVSTYQAYSKALNDLFAWLPQDVVAFHLTLQSAGTTLGAAFRQLPLSSLLEVGL